MGPEQGQFWTPEAWAAHLTGTLGCGLRATPKMSYFDTFATILDIYGTKIRQISRGIRWEGSRGPKRPKTGQKTKIWFQIFPLEGGALTRAAESASQSCEVKSETLRSAAPARAAQSGTFAWASAANAQAVLAMPWELKVPRYRIAARA